MKKLFIVLAVLVLCFCCLFGTSTVAYAESIEQEQTVTENEIVEDTSEVSDSDNLDTIAQIVAKINKLSDDEYFAKFILPVIIGVAVVLLLGLAVLVPSIKKSNKYKQLQILYTKVLEENELLQKMMSSTNPEEIRQLYEEFMSKFEKGELQALNLNTKFFDEFMAKIKTIEEKLNNITNGALNAWSSSKEAVKALTNSAETSTIVKLEQQARALKDYIRTTKGDEAEDIIQKITEV